MDGLSTALIVGGSILFLVIFGYGIGFTRIGTDEIGIIEKWWSLKGSIKGAGIIALNKEAGFEPDLLRAGVHFKTPFKYKVKKIKLITIPQGQIGYIFARSGNPLENGQTLGRMVECDAFQNVRNFLNNGGQKGPQRKVLREGTYVINLAQFIVITRDKVYSIATNKDETSQVESMRNEIADVHGFEPVRIGSFSKRRIAADLENPNNAESVGDFRDGISTDTMGIVTVLEGPTPDSGAIIAPLVGGNISDENYHNNFQEPEKFLDAGGRKGKQMQVLIDGEFFINRLFATVDIVPKTYIEIGMVGVVVSYFGEEGTDLSGTDYSHGELVEKGKKGIWKDALAPGKYAFNTYAGKVVTVPTTNVILKWISGQSGSHKLDDNLKEISLITKDAFEPNLPLTVVFNIDYRKASSVIQRFGDIKLLIEQSLDPMVAGYFKNIGQTKTLIELVQDRSMIQKQSSQEMKEKFKEYDLELKEVLIGTPTKSANDTRIEDILSQLREREVAKEEIKTNEAKQLSAVKKKELNEAQAKADAQKNLTQSAIDIEVADNQGRAQLKLAEQEAQKIQTLAEADKFKRQQEADAEKYTNIAKAEANAKSTELGAQAGATQVTMAADAEAHKLTVTGKAQAENIKMVADATAEQEEKVGKAKGLAAQALVDAYGGAEMQVKKVVLEAFAKALETSGAPIVPQTVISSGIDGKVPNALEGIMSLVLANMATTKDSQLVDMFKTKAKEE